MQKPTLKKLRWPLSKTRRLRQVARLYCDEQFPREVSEQLSKMGHDVLTVQAINGAVLP